MKKMADVLLTFLLACVLLECSTSASGAPTQSCAPTVKGVRFVCPPGWQIIDENHPRPETVVIGNFAPNPDKRMSSIIPAGKSTISIGSKPDLYRTIDEWISATEHMVPESKETIETFSSKSHGKISARCFTAAPSPQKPGDRTCLFVISNIPLMIDLFVSPKATNVLELEGYVGQMIETAEISSK
jgi:hypothetical protein